MDTTLARCGLTVLIGALAAAGCGDARGRDGSGEQTAQLAEAVSLNITLANEVGRLVSGGNGLARRYYAYDVRGRATAVEHVLDNTPYVFSSTYGFQCSSSACTATTTAANGPVVVASTFPDSETVTYTFDAGGAAQAIDTTPAGGTTQPIVNKILRNSRGQTVEVDYGDKTSTIHHYDDTTDLWLNEIETYLTATPTSVLQLYQYSFDGNGNLTSLTDYCNESSTVDCSQSGNSTYSATYTYDSRDQLVQTVRGGVTHPYSYDAIGNLTSMEGTTQTYFLSGAGKSLPHALESVGVVSYQYDANGNTTGTTGASTNTAITWNAENMPVTTVYGSNTTSKWFVGESMWKKILGAATTHYLPSMRDEGSTPCASAPCAYRKYYGSFAERDWTDTTTCAGLLNPADGCLKFYHGDHLGSSTAVTNVSGTVVHRQSYTPFGEDIVTSPPGPFTPVYQFNFKEHETVGTPGYYDYGARMYNPATGRFLSPDSVLGEQRYTYCNNDPERLVDPTGHQAAQPESTTTWEDVGGGVVIVRLNTSVAITDLSTRFNAEKAIAEDWNDHGPYRVRTVLGMKMPGVEVTESKLITSEKGGTIGYSETVKWPGGHATTTYTAVSPTEVVAVITVSKDDDTKAKNNGIEGVENFFRQLFVPGDTSHLPMDQKAYQNANPKEKVQEATREKTEATTQQDKDDLKKYAPPPTDPNTPH